MDFMKTVFEKAVELRKTIVLPEGNEPRTLKAAEIIKEKGLAKVILVGSENEIRKTAAAEQVDINRVQIVEPAKSEWFNDFVKTF